MQSHGPPGQTCIFVASPGYDFHEPIIPTIFRASFFLFSRRLKIVRLRARGRDCARFMGAAWASRRRGVPTRALLSFALTTYGQTFASRFDIADESTTRLDRAMDSLLSPLVDIVYIPSKTRGESFRFPPRARSFRRYDRRASRFEDSANIRCSDSETRIQVLCNSIDLSIAQSYISQLWTFFLSFLDGENRALSASIMLHQSSFQVWKIGKD